MFPAAAIKSMGNGVLRGETSRMPSTMGARVAQDTASGLDGDVTPASGTWDAVSGGPVPVKLPPRREAERQPAWVGKEGQDTEALAARER